MTHYDAIVIGSGQGGVPLAKALATAGKPTLLIERKDLGGTCVNYGCTPTKTLYNSARVAYLTKRATDFGVVSPRVTVDMAAVQNRVQEMVQSFREGIERDLAEVKNLSLVRGHARFVDSRTIRIDQTGEEFRAPTIVINTGTRPLIPAISGLDALPFLSNSGALDLSRLPESLLILGGGAIGLEFAQIFRRLGSEVTLIGKGNCLLAAEDRDVSEAVLNLLRDDGIDVVLGDSLQRVSGRAGDVHLQMASGRQIRGADLLVAVGRKPNTDDLGLEATQVQLDSRGFVSVDHHLRTAEDGVFAIGDVKGGPQFTHVSYDDFRILFANLMSSHKRTTEARQVPYVLYLDPQLGRFGPSESQLRSQNRKYRVAKLGAEHIARANEMGETRGFVKALVDAQSNRILSATTFCIEGGELLGPLQLAIEHEIPYTALRDGVFAHPTIAECLNNLFATL